MKITILVIGSRGDVQPLIALGSGLKRAGHEVKIATHDIFKEMITSRGLEFFPIYGNPKEVLVEKEGREWLNTNLNMISFSWKLKNLIQSYSIDILDDLWRACYDTDAIMFSILSVVGPDIAEKLQIPCFATLLQPVTPTYEFPSFMAPPVSNFNKFYNKLTGLLGEQLYWQIFSKSVNRWRKEFLKLHKKPFYGPFREMRDKKLPILYGFSPTVIPKPSDWPSWIYITGYWFLDRSPEWKAPEELIDFLESGPPPVYIGFGSMNIRNPEGITDIVLDALHTTGQRGILGVTWSGLWDRELPDYVFRVESIPFDWLFPRMAAVIHHGGAGTTASALRAGIPSVIIPFFGDQFFWARRVYNLKAGPLPIKESNLNTETLSRAIKKALKSKEIIARAKEIGQKIRSENGVEKAVQVIEKICIFN